MKKIFYVLIFIFMLLILNVNNSYSGPFGTFMGEPISSFDGLVYKKTNKEGFKVYAYKNPKVKHPDMVMYQLLFDNDDKLCGITASSKKFTGEEGKIEARRIYNKLIGQFNQKYLDILREEFKKPGIVGFDWQSKNDNLSLPDDLLYVSCMLVGGKGKKSGEDKYFIILTYKYKNSSEVYNKNEIDSL